MEQLKIDKTKTALVVIDLQKGIVARKTAPHDPVLVVSNASKIAEAFRKNNMPVFLIRVTPSGDLKDGLRPMADSEASNWKNLPADWSEPVPEMNRQPSDFLITKRQWGAFYGTELDLQLRRRGIDTIVLCGISTDIGVESTARSAYEHGYNQIFAEDAMSAMSEAGHIHAVKEIFPRIGFVRSTAEIISAL